MRFNKHLNCLLPLSLAGPGNQYCGLKEGLIMAHVLGKSLVLPLFIPHGTIRKSSKPFYSFGETFDQEHFISSCKEQLNVDVLLYEEVESALLDANMHSAVIIRSDEGSTRQALEYLGYYRDVLTALVKEEDVEVYNDVKTFLRSPEDIRQWYQQVAPQDPPLFIPVGLFNNLKLGGINFQSNNKPCGKNHCLNCPPNPAFAELYSKVEKTLRFSEDVRAWGDEYIDTHFGNHEFLGFHLRICDLPKNRTFSECYSGHSETEVQAALHTYCAEHGVRKEDVFLATPPQLFTKVDGLQIFTEETYTPYFNPTLDSHISALVEQHICSKSKIFIRSYTNTPDVPRKAHTRSSWAELVEGVRRPCGLDLNFTIDERIDDLRRQAESGDSK